MAEHAALDTAPSGDAENYGERKDMYVLFVNIVKYGAAAIATILILMAIFLT